ncbi:Rne/Rng family ribonuclease [Roseinatronobacter alkalisoli]|uniref:Ribonuclease E n=1 Tax=Roseinatronobacter alkalisoli TaxID=3028235 RepID=A0ABT5TAF1_9RHOB|nr:Rne/Rng family ribonuclease [Roseinatronobacter sp. HJB301]MDD7972103.1 Rne/Rng family ribonuclease [Roseinatronobacter sp. HJB301]
MAQKMLIDATHAEETRVVVVDGNKVEEFDFETASRRQLAGNIYLAKVTRVEPSLQAAFVDYGGNRHGFLAFNEIHPDYYQIPAEDRAALLAEERASVREQDDDDRASGGEKAEKPAKKPRRSSNRRKPAAKAETVSSSDTVETRDVSGMDILDNGDDSDTDTLIADGFGAAITDDTPAPQAEASPSEDARPAETDAPDAPDETYRAADHAAENDDRIEAVSEGGDPVDEVQVRRKPRPRRYKIQEVVRVRQIMLVQVVKEERGNKGAALTTYLSLAGRYCVLMPNTARGGGISRKITNAADRQKLKAIANEIKVPEGAGLIIRTAGANRTKAEIKRDYEYLFRLWEQIRELTLKSIAPTPIYEEGNLIKRSIRDLYNRDIDEVLVEGEAGYRVAKDFMKMIMPSHARNVKLYSDTMPLFARHQVESYLAGMMNPTVQLPSGGYIVIGVTEALVAIDINSGRATREGSIEDTALKTNLEAAAEIARQLRLRDLAGLIVIDFIDMEERKNNAAVEKMLKDKLKSDRARIQVGRISGFGLLEMSRQRLRPGMLEATTQPCPHCHGTGLIRSDDSMGLTILRQIEEEGTRGKSREVLVRAPAGAVNFLFNFKREHIAQIEGRYGMAVRLEADPLMVSPDFSLERFKTATRVSVQPSTAVVSLDASHMSDLEEDDIAEIEDAVVEPAESEETADQPRKKRRRRRRKRGGKENGADGTDANASDQSDTEGDTPPDSENTAVAAEQADAPAVAVTGAADAAEEVVAKPKRTRKPRAKKVVEPASESLPAADTQQDTQPEGAGAETPDAPKEKPARKPRTRRKPAAKAAAEPASESPAEAPVDVAEMVETPMAGAEAPAPVETVAEPVVLEPEPTAQVVVPTVPDENAPGPAPEVVAPAQDQPMEDAAEPVSEAQAEEPVAETPAKPAPKRRGWWSLKI